MLALAVLAAVVPSLVAAQSSAAVASAAASIPGCALTCTLQIAGSSECGGVTNVTCLCTNASFQRDVYQCYVNTCQGTDLQSAIAYGAQACQQVGVTLDTSAVPSGVTGVSTAASGSTGSAASSTPATTSAPTTSASNAASSPATTSSPGAAAHSFAQGNGLLAMLGSVVGLAGFATLLL